MQFNLIRWKNRCFANVFPMLRLVGRYLCTVVWTCLCVYECVCTNVCMRVYEFCIYYDLFVMSERHMYADDGETFWHTVLYLWCTFLGSRPASVRCACTLSPIHICTHTHTHRYKNWRTQICINIEPEGGGVLVTRISVWLGIIYKSGMNFTEAKHVVNHSTATLPHANRQYRLLYTLGLRAAQTEMGNSNVQRRLYER